MILYIALPILIGLLVHHIILMHRIIAKPNQRSSEKVASPVKETTEARDAVRKLIGIKYSIYLTKVTIGGLNNELAVLEEEKELLEKEVRRLVDFQKTNEDKK